ncbi:[protein-PII] uridylyltransferase [Blastococcus sp. Marseille-P5729]|uniref:[protein-PII] uridylyltransferase n=1 Tax=Blastococcus sp. Marseille-P5729 TaxID=2086582 RepID=UPI001F34649D|nr:[protein-PII] uridylyltransferase [Blastococcus sp. Marseille-P5729]
MVGSELRARLTAQCDRWLASLIPQDQFIALVAVGGLGREEPAPYSDLDLVLLHDLSPKKVRAVADSIWYPIWDSGIGLDHSVRTVAETARLAASDVKVSLGLLDARFIAGNEQLAGEARARIAAAWRVNAATRAEELQRAAFDRAAAFGHVAYLLQPNLKQSYGGLRDAMVLRALARAQLIDVRPEARAAIETLLDVRGEVQRHARRATDVLRAQERAAIAASLGHEDGTALLRSVNGAGRTIAHAVDTAFRRAATRREEDGGGGLRARLRRPSRLGPVREGLAKDVVRHAGFVVLARNAQPQHDPGLLMRVARAAAYADLPISSFTLDRLRIETPEELDRWTDEMRHDFGALLAAGPPLLRVWESLDQHGLLTRLLPEWDHVRSLAQHNAIHTFTVDRHLLQTAIEAGVNDIVVSRPDLLRVGALLHDIGKGLGGDHSEIGAGIARGIACRMGFREADCDLIELLVRHHLLLPVTAQRRDLTDPRTVETVIEKVGSSPVTIDLLHALSIADSKATGPAAYSQWKADLIAELVTRVRAAQAGETIDELDMIDDLATDLISAEPDEMVSVAIGRAPGAYQRLLVVLRDDMATSQVAGTLALSSLGIRRARLVEVDGCRLLDHIVEPRFGSMPGVDELTDSLNRVHSGALDLRERLRRKAVSYDRGATDLPRVRWIADAATNASVLEVQAADRTALLYHLMCAFERAGAQVRSAVIESYGPSVVDTFYLQTADETVLGADCRHAVEMELQRLGWS